MVQLSAGRTRQPALCLLQNTEEGAGGVMILGQLGQDNINYIGNGAVQR